MKPELCTEIIQDLKSRIEELEIEKQQLENRRKKPELPRVDRRCSRPSRTGWPQRHPGGDHREQTFEIALGFKAVPPRVLHGEPAERKASW